MQSSDHRTRSHVAALVAAIALIAVAGSVAATTSPQRVTIESTMVVAGQFNTGTFTRTLGSELICAHGDVVDTRYVWGASHGTGVNPTGAQLLVDKTFDCGDGHIFLRLQIQGVFVSEVFTWVVRGGTGAYTGLRGQGDGWTDYSSFATDGTVVNYYTGFLVQ